MKTFLKNLLFASFLLVSMSVSAQKISAQKIIVQDLESWMSDLISRVIDKDVKVSMNFGQERDIQEEGMPLKWRCDVITFTLPKRQRFLFSEMIRAFELNGHNNPYCYSINTLTKSYPQSGTKRNLIIGDDMNRYITIGDNYSNYLNVNILDDKDTTKTHRYAYALEWKEDYESNVHVRYIVTYAKIPQ